MKTYNYLRRQAFSGLLLLCTIFLMMGFSVTNADAQATATFTTSGTFTVPAGITSIQVECWGGGGGGGGGATVAGAAGGGGGGGAYSKNVSVAVTPGNTYTVTVGTGGAAGAAAGGNGGAGNPTSFNGASVLAAGGTGGTGAITIVPGLGGIGGTAAASIGIVKFSAGSGAAGLSASYGGGGGSGAGTAANGNSATTGTGATGPAGGGNGGNGATTPAGAAGSAGTTPGGGGGGGRRGTTATNRAGGAGARGQVVISYACPMSLPEGFTSGVVPPACWSINNSTYMFYNSTSGYGVGTGSLQYDFYLASSGTLLDFTTPGFTPTVAGTTLSFDEAYATYSGEVDNLVIKTSTNGGASYTTLITYTGGSSGTLNTGGTTTSQFIPTSTQWQTKSIVLPTGTNKIIFEGVSGFGNELYIDNINIATSTACSGTPSPGATVSTANAVCSGVTFSLSLGTSYNGVSGLTFQWQSSPNGSTWTNISGATSAALTTSQSAGTYYQCLVTCSGNTGISTPLQVAMNSFVNCFCVPTTTNGCGSGDHITNVTFTSNSSPINNNTGACLTASYSDYTGTVAAAVVGQSDLVPISVSVNDGGTEYAGAWIDFNHSGTFDASEFITLTDADGFAPWIYTGSVTIPNSSTLGVTRMRFRSSYSATIAGSSACSTYSYGETEDYLVNILPPCATTFNVTGGGQLCTGGAGFPINLSGSTGGFSYQLRLNNVNIGAPVAGTGNAISFGNQTSIGTYTVIATQGSCITSMSGSAVIVSVASPSLSSVTASPNAVLSGGSSTLTATLASSTTYCTPFNSSDCQLEDNITHVSFAGINRTSGCDASIGGFNFFPSPSGNVIAGQIYTLSVSTGTGNFTDDGVAVWIDYNHDGVFSGSELVYSSYSGADPATYTTNISIPVSAINGSTRMRVRNNFSQAPTDPCSNQTYGETEDYVITITGGVSPALTYSWTPSTFLASTTTNPAIATGVTATTIYSVTVTNAAGCSASGSDTVEVSSMVYDHTTVTQVTSPSCTSPGALNVPILQMVVYTNGLAGTINMDGFQVDIGGTGNAQWVSNARIYYTGNSPVFATTTPYAIELSAGASHGYGSFFMAPSGGTFPIGNIGGNATTAHYFWLAYDVYSGAAACGGVLDGQVSYVQADDDNIEDYSVGAQMPVSGNTSVSVANNFAPSGNSISTCAGTTLTWSRACGYTGNYDVYLNGVPVPGYMNTNGTYAVTPALLPLSTYTWQVQVAGSAYVSGCTAQTFQTAAIIAPAASIGTISGPSSGVCGNTYTYSTTYFNDAMQWQISLNNVSFSNLSGFTSPTAAIPANLGPGTFYIRAYAVAVGLCATDTVFSNVLTAVINGPTVTVTPSSSTVCPGVSVTLTASTDGPGPYLWNTGATTQSIVVNPSVTTSYSVTAGTFPSTASPYCLPTYTFFDGTDYISNVTLNTINNNSGATDLPGYSNNLGVSTNLVAGNTYSISVTDGAFDTSENIRAWIDYNQSGTFDSGEEILPNSISSTAFQTFTATFTVPATATNGSTRLRVVDNYATTPVPACVTEGFGETEDYTIVIGGGLIPFGGCNATAIATVVIGGPITTPTVTPSASACPGTSRTLDAGTVTGVLSGPVTYLWSPGGQTTSSVVVNPTVTTVYTLTVSDGVCPHTYTVNVPVYNPPVLNNVTATPSSVCMGATSQLTVSASGAASNVVIMSNNFNGSAADWTVTDNSVGVDAPVAWSLQSSPYYVGISSPGADQFFAANSDVGGFSQTITDTKLTSPSFSTVGYTSLTLDFDQYFDDWTDGDQVVNVEVSTNGTSWTPVENYLGNAQGSAASFSHATINLNAFIGNPTVFIRYNYVTVWGFYWAVDNFSVSGTIPPFAYAWSPSGTLSSGTIQNPVATPTSSSAYSVTVTDGHGCIVSGSTSVSVVLPTISCPQDISVCTSQGVCGYTGSIGTATSPTQPCSHVITHSGGSNLPVGDNFITWTVTDDFNNTASCVQKVTVSDCEFPVITCPADITMDCSVANTSTANCGEATATDNCGATVSYSDAVTNFICTNSYTITRTWTATDAAGNAVNCNQTIIVQDLDAPVIAGNCFDQTLECPDAPVFCTLTATDNCSPFTLTYADVNTPVCGGSYISARTWTATDDCGNVSTSTQTITVEDVTPPVISNVGGTSVVMCPAVPVFDVAVATDECSNYSLSYTDQIVTFCAGSYAQTREWTATDDCGNSTTMSQTIYVLDNTAPTISGVGGPQTIECPAAPVFSNPTYNDACSNGFVYFSYSDATTPSCGGSYHITRTWTAIDGCSNSSSASQCIHVLDHTAPVISSVPAPSTIQCPATPVFCNPTATDACSNRTFTYADVTTPHCGSTYTKTRTWTATDDCGNTSTKSQTINVEDHAAPVITGVNASATISCPSAPVWSNPTAADACGTNTMTYADVTTNGCGGTYTKTRTWTAVDGCGNSSSASQTYTVIDTIAPVIVGIGPGAVIDCPAAAGVFSTPTATDACVTPVLTYQDTIITGCGNSYTITRIWTANDGCNTTEGYQTFMYQDTTRPVISGIPPSTTTSTTVCSTATTTGNVVCVVSYNGPASCHNVYRPNYILGNPNGSGAKIKTNGGYIVAKLGHNLPATTVYTVKWRRKTGNNGSHCGSHFGGSNGASGCNAPASMQVYESTNGTTFTLRGTYTTTTSASYVSLAIPANVANTRYLKFVNTGGCSEIYIDAVTYSISVTSCVTTTTMTGSTTVYCPVSVNSVFALVNATDACTTPTLTYTDVTTPGSCLNNFTVVRTWVATDACGNSTSSVQTVISRDTTPPVITCAADLILCDGDPDPVIADPAVTDACGGPVTMVRTRLNPVNVCQHSSSTHTCTHHGCGNTSCNDHTGAGCNHSRSSHSGCTHSGCGNTACTNYSNICSHAHHSHSGCTHHNCGNSSCNDHTNNGCSHSHSSHSGCSHSGCGNSACNNYSGHHCGHSHGTHSGCTHHACGNSACNTHTASHCSHSHSSHSGCTHSACGNTACANGSGSTCSHAHTSHSNCNHHGCGNSSCNNYTHATCQHSHGVHSGCTHNGCGNSMCTNPGTGYTLGTTTLTWTATDACGNVRTCVRRITRLDEISATIAQVGSSTGYCQGTGGNVVLTATGTGGLAPYSYLWSNGATTQSITVTANGTYTVTVTSSGSNCTGTASSVVSNSSNDMLRHYTIIGRDNVHLHGYNILSNGGVGVTASTGSASSGGGGWAKIHDHSLVTSSTTFVKADNITIDGSSSVATQYPVPSTVVLPTFDNGGTPNSTNVTVPSYTTVTLNGTVYGNINVGAGATLIFGHATIDLKELNIDHDAIVKFTQPCTRIRMSDQLDIDKFVVFNPASDGKDVAIYLRHVNNYGSGHGSHNWSHGHGSGGSSDVSVDIDYGATIKAFIYARDGKINVNGGSSGCSANNGCNSSCFNSTATTTMTGLFIARSIKAHGRTNWNWNTVCATCNYSLREGEEAAKTLQSEELNSGLLIENYPDPFKDKTNIRFVLDRDTHATVDIYDLNGKFIKTVFNGDVIAKKEYKFEFDATDLASGMYIYKVITPEDVHTGKMMLVKE